MPAGNLHLRSSTISFLPMSFSMRQNVRHFFITSGGGSCCVVLCAFKKMGNVSDTSSALIVRSLSLAPNERTISLSWVCGPKQRQILQRLLKISLSHWLIGWLNKSTHHGIAWSLAHGRRVLEPLSLFSFSDQLFSVVIVNCKNIFPLVFRGVNSYLPRFTSSHGQNVESMT
jgi:hypothetical protein